VSNWPALILVVTVLRVLRWRGNSWPMTAAKLVGMGVNYLAAVTIARIVIARLW
jgi:hypothetical protein